MKYKPNNIETGLSRAFQTFATASYDELKVLKKTKNEPEFTELIYQLLPEVKRFINKNLSVAISKGLIPSNKYKKDDIIDSLLIKIHDDFDQITNENDLYPYIFQKANDILHNLISNEEFERHNFKNIDDFTKIELNEMQENYTSDMDENPILIDDLDDSDLKKSYDYMPNHVFIEDMNEMELELFQENELSLKDFNTHIDMILYNLPRSSRNIFELSTIYQFYPAEVAKIQRTDNQAIKASLTKTKHIISVSLAKRFLNKRLN